MFDCLHRHSPFHLALIYKQFIGTDYIKKE
nr:MAG TPA: hypothetical protein [Bacteriophage sp.]